MKSIKTSLVAASILVLSSVSFSQYEDGNLKKPKTSVSHNTNSKHALGLAAGGTTGFGISYLYMPSRLCFQVAFLPYKDQSSSFYCAGLTFIYRVREGEKLNFLLYQGNHFISRSQTNYVYNPNSYMSIANGNTTTNGFNNGIGLGFEFFLSENVSFNLMGGYAGYNNFETITITGEGGLFYKF